MSASVISKSVMLRISINASLLSLHNSYKNARKICLDLQEELDTDTYDCAVRKSEGLPIMHVLNITGSIDETITNAYEHGWSEYSGQSTYVRVILTAKVIRDRLSVCLRRMENDYRIAQNIVANVISDGLIKNYQKRVREAFKYYESFTFLSTKVLPEVLETIEKKLGPVDE